jgi:hypothetical protein
MGELALNEAEGSLSRGAKKIKPDQLMIGLFIWGKYAVLGLYYPKREYW